MRPGTLALATLAVVFLSAASSRAATPWLEGVRIDDGRQIVRSETAAPASIAVESEPTKLVFSSTGVTAPVTPGAMTAWLLIGRAYSGYTTRYFTNGDLLTDDDSDGHVTWLWPVDYPYPMPPAGIWTATDLTSGEIMAGSPGSSTVPLRRPLGNDVLLRDTAGNFSYVVLPIDDWQLVQWARPGVGAWVVNLTDSGSKDLDEMPDGTVVFNTSSMQPVGGSPPPPAGIVAGDMIVGINFFGDTQVWFGDRSENLFGTSADPSIVSFPGGGITYTRRETDGFVRFPVLRTHTAEHEVIVDYAITPVNAQPGVHYDTQGGEVRFAPGEIVKTIEIPILDDELWSGTTAFDVSLATADGATIVGDVLHVSIEDDETPPAVSVSTASSSIMELDSGTISIPVTVQLSEPALRPLTISWLWRASTDAIDRTGSFELAPGVTQQTFDMSYTANTVPEADRVLSFYAGYSTSSGSRSGSGSVTITDDDRAQTPTGLTAAAAGTSRVDLSWIAEAKATSYEVHRSAAGISDTVVTVNANGYADTNVAPDHSYIYRVLAVSSDGSKSLPSVPDAATTTNFADVITAGTAARSAHLSELKTAVNAMRGAAGLSSFEFSAPAAQNDVIRASHVTQLRTALDEARQQIGLSTLSYTDATIQNAVTRVKAAHINEIRDGCR